MYYKENYAKHMPRMSDQLIYRTIWGIIHAKDWDNALSTRFLSTLRIVILSIIIAGISYGCDHTILWLSRTPENSFFIAWKWIFSYNYQNFSSTCWSSRIDFMLNFWNSVSSHVQDLN